jgi:hypothetical protein
MIKKAKIFRVWVPLNICPSWKSLTAISIILACFLQMGCFFGTHKSYVCYYCICPQTVDSLQRSFLMSSFDLLVVQMVLYVLWTWQYTLIWWTLPSFVCNTIKGWLPLVSPSWRISLVGKCGICCLRNTFHLSPVTVFCLL